MSKNPTKSRRYEQTSKPAARASDNPNAPRETTTGPKVTGKGPTGAHKANPRYGQDKITHVPFPGLPKK